MADGLPRTVHHNGDQYGDHEEGLGPLLPIFPYELGMTYADAMDVLSTSGHEYTSYPEHYPNIEITFFVADIRDVELASKIKSSMNGYSYQLPGGYLPDIAVAAQFFALQGSAVLRISKGREGMHLPQAHEVSLSTPADRETRKYYQRSDVKAPEPYPFPHRERDSLLLGQPTTRSSDKTYVVIIHMPTFRGFTLGGGYGTLDVDAPHDLMVDAMRYNRQTDFGYSGGHNWPEWTDGIPKSEFVGYWVAE